MKKSFLNYLKSLFTKKEKLDSERKRELLTEIGLNFYDWAQEFFTRNKLNTLVSIISIMEDYNDNPDVFKHITTLGLKTKLKKYCEIKGYELNPIEYVNSQNGRIFHWQRMEQARVECVFIKTH